MASQDVEETVIQCGVQTSPHSKPILVLTASHAEAEGQTGLAKGCSSNDASTTAADAQPTQISHGCRGPHDRRSPRNRQSRQLIEECDEHLGNRADRIEPDDLESVSAQCRQAQQSGAGRQPTGLGMRGIGLKRAQHRRLGDIARRPRSHPIVMGNSPSATGNSLLTLRDENAVCRRRERAPFRPAAMRASHPPSCSSGIIPEKCRVVPRPSATHRRAAVHTASNST